MGEAPDTAPGVVAPGDEVLGRYRLLRRIARGGMGTVWEAFDTRLHQRVALKRVAFGAFGPAHADDTKLRTLREARTAAQLRGQPHVVDVFDVQEEGGDVWIVLEFVPSRSLAEVLEDGPLDPARAARIGAEIARALQVAHGRRILHRDVKPANVLIADADGAALLTDFGISHTEDDPRITAADVVTGTPAYMAPEVARGEASTAASDVFCLGATLYSCVEGNPPFGPADNPRRAMYRAAAGEVTEPRRAGPLTGLLAGMLSRDPAARPDAATAADLLTGVAHRTAAPASTVTPAGPPVGAAAGGTAVGGTAAGSSPARPGSPAATSGLGSPAATSGPGSAATSRPGSPASTSRPGLAATLMAPGSPAQVSSPEALGAPPAAGRPGTGGEPGTAGGSGTAGRRTSRRRRVAVVLGAVAALAVGSAATTVALTRAPADPVPGPRPTTGAFPTVTGPRTVTGDPRDVDACALVDPAALRAIGTARVDTRTAPDSCRAHLTGTAGPFDLFVRLVVANDIDGRTTPQAIGSLKVRTGPRYTNTAGHESCKGYVVLSDGTAVESLAVGAAAPAADPCPLSTASTRTIAGIVDRSGVPSNPARNAGYSMRTADACALVPATAVAGAVGTGAVAVPGWAHWSCHWKGTTGSMTILLTGGTGDVKAWGTPLAGAARPTATQGRRGQCSSTVQHKAAARPTDRAEYVQVTVDRKAAAPTALCPVSTALATAAEGRAG